MADWRGDRIGSAERGENPTVLARMKSGFAVIGDTQFLPGYCVLLASPLVEHLTDLDERRRIDFLHDMSLVGQAIMDVCQPRRINYSILGNADHYLHAHVQARYDWEPEEYRRGPAFGYPREMWTGEQHQFSEEKHGDLKARLTARLLELISSASR